MSVELSICIPTYNRAQFLEECLQSVLLSITGHEDQIEIIISDNASTDNTGDIVRAIQEMHPWIRYHRNEQNIGGDRNIYAVAAMGVGKYIWVIGDDDKIEPEAIERVLEKIRSGYGLIICNYSVWAKDFSYVIKNTGLPLGCDEVFNNPDKLMRRIGYHVGYISSIIIKNDIFFKIPESEYLNYIDYGFPQIYAVYSGIFQHCNAIYISSALVCNRSGNSGNYDWWKYFVKGTSLIFEALSGKGYAKNAIIAAKHQILKEAIIPQLCSMRIRGEIDRRIHVRLMTTYYKNNWLFWLIGLPVLLVPTSIARIGKGIVMMIRNI